MFEHVDGQPGKLRVREREPKVSQHLGLRSVVQVIGVDADAVAHKVLEGRVRVVQDVSATHPEQVLELLLQRVVDGRHEHKLPTLARKTAAVPTLPHFEDLLEQPQASTSVRVHGDPSGCVIPPPAALAAISTPD